MWLTVPWGRPTWQIPENLFKLQNCIMPCVLDACACSVPRPEKAISISPSQSRLPHQVSLLTRHITSRAGVGGEGTPHLNKFRTSKIVAENTQAPYSLNAEAMSEAVTSLGRALMHNKQVIWQCWAGRPAQEPGGALTGEAAGQDPPRQAASAAAAALGCRTSGMLLG